MDIKAAVKQLTHKHKTNNPYELAQLLNIIVMYAELGSTWGYYTTYKRSKFIIINQNISEELQSYTCAHELGLSVLHKGVSTPFLKAHTLFSIEKIERQANTFAVELLLPDELLQQYPETSIHRLADMVGVPMGLEVLKK